MRITGGAWASRRVAGPARASAVRPTPDALREQAFAILGPRLRGSTFLDLFAGTGINSLEALSRGASEALLVERAAASAALIRRNLSALGAPTALFEVLELDVRRALAVLARQQRAAAAAWCDPPFSAWEEGPGALALARELGVLRAGALVVLEAPPKAVPAIEGFEVARQLRGAFLLRAA